MTDSGTQTHIDYVAECLVRLFEQREDVTGMRLLSSNPVARHMTARLEPLDRRAWMRTAGLRPALDMQLV